MSINVVVLDGRLRGVPMAREWPDGGCSVNFSLAHDIFISGKGRVTDWHNCVAKDRVARYLCEHGVQGQVVTVKGRLIHRVYTREDTKEDVKVTEIECEEISLGRLPRGNGETPA